MRILSILTASVFGIVLMACASGGPPAPPPGTPTAVAPPSSPAPMESEEASGGGSYTAEQAERGRTAFTDSCVECHAASEFSGSDFEFTWRRRSVWNLYSAIWLNMPEDDPGGLPRETYTDIVAYILQLNEYAAGEEALVATEDVMRGIPLGPGVDKSGAGSGGVR